MNVFVEHFEIREQAIELLQNWVYWMGVRRLHGCGPSKWVTTHLQLAALTSGQMIERMRLRI